MSIVRTPQATARTPLKEILFDENEVNIPHIQTRTTTKVKFHNTKPKIVSDEVVQLRIALGVIKMMNLSLLKLQRENAFLRLSVNRVQRKSLATPKKRRMEVESRDNSSSHNILAPDLFFSPPRNIRDHLNSNEIPCTPPSTVQESSCAAGGPKCPIRSSESPLGAEFIPEINLKPSTDNLRKPPAQRLKAPPFAPPLTSGCDELGTCGTTMVYHSA